MTIAVLLTCHNRRQKTEICLRSLKAALDEYNNNISTYQHINISTYQHINISTYQHINIEIFLTDDGCTDGTADAARRIFPDPNTLHILPGNGNLYWAGGMRLAWLTALSHLPSADYFLLLNDDTELMPNLFPQLLQCQNFALEQFGKQGLVSGITCSKSNPSVMTYGGDVWTNKFLAKKKRLQPNGAPQLCDMTNANILLVPSSIVDNLGILYRKYRHSQADLDYSIMACKAGYPLLLTPHFCGFCDKDHPDKKTIAKNLMAMNLRERKAFYSNPINSNHDYLLYFLRINPLRLPLVWIGRTLNLYLPHLYYWFDTIRNH